MFGQHFYHKQIRNAVTELLKERIEGFNERLPTIMSLGNPVMEDRHWESVFKVLGKRYMSGQTFTLSQLVELKIYLKYPIRIGSCLLYTSDAADE